jgi:hypothetical protein
MQMRLGPRQLPASERLREKQALTIGVSFFCPDGFVFGSDRQLTDSGGFKYEERKIFRFIDNNWSMIFSYAGDPETAKLFFQRLFDQLGDALQPSRSSNEFPRKLVRDVVEKIYKDKLSKEIQTLIGVSVKDCGAILFKTKKTKVVAAGAAEYIGVGDSSAIRYLCDFLVRNQPSIREAEILASYIVSVANRYVEGCSGGPDITALYMNGQISEKSGGMFPDQEQLFSHYEAQIGRGLRELLLAGGKYELGLIKLPNS